MESRARDKYGTGFSSINQREAPDRGKLLQWNASTTFRAAAVRAQHSSTAGMLRCARTRYRRL